MIHIFKITPKRWLYEHLCASMLKIDSLTDACAYAKMKRMK